MINAEPNLVKTIDLALFRPEWNACLTRSPGNTHRISALGESPERDDPSTEQEVGCFDSAAAVAEGPRGFKVHRADFRDPDLFVTDFRPEAPNYQRCTLF